jgi:anaerobic glycerol-3-phosphate dehydrogenase
MFAVYHHPPQHFYRLVAKERVDKTTVQIKSTQTDAVDDFHQEETKEELF